MLLAIPFAYLTSILSSIFGNDQATMVFAGDAMMHKTQIAAARNSAGAYDYSTCFDPLKDYISQADFAVVNLETPLGGSPYTGYPCFSAPDSYAEALLNAGFDFMWTANNHSLDRQDRGVRRTLQTLDMMGIPHVGSYDSQAQRDTILPCLHDVNGIKVGFLSYTYGTNGIKATNGAIVDYIDKAQIKKDIQRTREAGAELLCVAMHWGVEYVLLPNEEQKRLAQFLVDQGVDMIIGGHPHVIQPMEMRKRDDGSNVLLIYSLGNFISGQRTTDTRGGMMARVFLSRDQDHKAQVDSAKYRLIYTVPPGPGHPNFQVMDADSVKGEWHAQCLKFIQRAEAVLSKENKGVPKEQTP